MIRSCTMGVARTRLAWIPLWLLSTLPACHSKFDSFCEEQRECLDANELDHEACVQRLEGREASAAQLGCESEFDAYLQCREQQSACDSGYFGDLDLRCYDEASALAVCTDLQFVDLRF